MARLDDELLNWTLDILVKENDLKFIEKNKVPSNMKEFKKIIIELEELYIKQFQKRYG